MANIIDVDYSQMQNARKQLLTQVNEYMESTGQVREIVSELSNEWEGDAQAAFNAEQITAMMFYDQMAQRVTTCADTLSKASARYAEADHTAAGFIKAANG